MGKRSFLSIVLLCVASSAVADEAPCRDDTVFLRGDWGNARFAVDVADTADLRSRGLMFVEDMPTMSGMLFVYDREQTVSFWMKNTLIPLDMIFADGAGVVQKVHENAVPGDLTGIRGGSNIQFVLEINGGMADRLGIEAGSEMRHPSIQDEIAVWACAS
ncbi:MAG: DUF192 domain-containing protein [Rhodobacteraceae bacterium]|jgi:uncharacterized membrane protein (UPF0127 family)|nr:DUF192 domain-containing protein [Paracoccaceae bacterium]